MGTLRLRLPFRHYPPPLLLAALDPQPPLFSRAHSISGRPFCEMGGGPLSALTNTTEGSPHQVSLLDLTRSSPSRPSLAPPLVATSVLAAPVPATPLPGAAPRGHARPGHVHCPSRPHSSLAPPHRDHARPGHARRPSRPRLSRPRPSPALPRVPATPLPGATPRGHTRPGHARRLSRSRSSLAPPLVATPVQATPAAHPGHACPGHNLQQSRS